jgi:hypothetical protein
MENSHSALFFARQGCDDFVTIALYYLIEHFPAGS